jgi:uncharacterized membrane protein YoaK (UPF0700 family)
LIYSAFFTIGNIFTTYIIGNLVLASATAVRGRPWRFRPSSLLWRLPGASHTSRTGTARPAHGVQFVLLVAVLIFGVSRAIHQHAWLDGWCRSDDGSLRNSLSTALALAVR